MIIQNEKYHSHIHVYEACNCAEEIDGLKCLCNYFYKPEGTEEDLAKSSPNIKRIEGWICKRCGWTVELQNEKDFR